MNDYYMVIGIIGLIGFCLGFVIAYWIKGKLVSQKVKAAEGEALRIVNDSKRQAETRLKEADLEVKDRHFKMKNEFDFSENQSDLIKNSSRRDAEAQRTKIYKNF